MSKELANIPEAPAPVKVADLPATIQAAMNKLDRDEQKIIIAAFQPKIREVDEGFCQNELIAAVTTAFTIAGQKPDAKTLAIYVDEFYNYLLENYPAMSVDEVKIALRQGVYADRTEKNQYFGLNVKTFVQFIREYLFSEARQEAKRNFEIQKSLSLPSRELTGEERIKDDKEFVNHLFGVYREGCLITDYIPAFMCKFLEDQQRLILSHEEKIAIKKRARSYYERMVINFKYNTAIGGSLRSLIVSQDPNTTISNIARQFAVYEFFEQEAAAGKLLLFEL